ncbi:MAG: hypothetical protein MZV70_46395 [Desulfobacterales bacterium]|nr:hypothetical protein [Desulfobacterales bacterium]
MLINGVEKLTCITPIRAVTRNGGKYVEPLQFPGLAICRSIWVLYLPIWKQWASSVLPIQEEDSKGFAKTDADLLRLADCIECGLCISACPIALTSPTYIGPAILAGAQQNGQLTACILTLVDSEMVLGAVILHTNVQRSAFQMSTRSCALWIYVKRISSSSSETNIWFEVRRRCMSEIQQSSSKMIKWFDPRNRKLGSWAFILN